MTRIAFFGFKASFDIHHVGGMDSLVRRLAIGFASLGDSIDLVQYGCSEASVDEIGCRVTQRKFVDLAGACQHLAANADHVVSIYLRPHDRIAYSRFRRAETKRLKFHHLYATWNESWLKRSLSFSEGRLYPFNGHVFSVSPRLHACASRFSSRAALLLPPVPNDYFRQPSEKSNNGKFRIAYAGRLDAGKGTSIAVEVLRRFASRNDWETRVYGYAWPHDAEGTRLHERLLAEPSIGYEPVNHTLWSDEVDVRLRERLGETDILLLPYQKLSSTVDMPLLFLEGMASLCAIATPPLGDLYETYGSSVFNLSIDWDVHSLVESIERGVSHLQLERSRLAERCAHLRFDTATTAAEFKRLLNDHV